MLIIRNASEVQRITHPGIRSLVALRFCQLNSPDGNPDGNPDGLDAPAADGCFIVVGAGDSVSEIEEAAGFPILTGLFDDIPFGHIDFQPCTEIFEEHRNEHSCIYEMVFIGSDDGTFASIWIPDEEGIDANLLAMCRSFATAAVTSP